MGYRLEISKIEHSACGGKLYGYIPDNELKNLKSYKWLLVHRYITGTDEEYWDYGLSPTIILSNIEFKEFIRLYNEDFKEYNDFDIIESSKEMQELIESNENKFLEWG